jgi:hypothetical protein
MSLRIRSFCLLLVLLPGLVSAQYGRSRRTRSPGPNKGVPDGATPLVNISGVLRSINKKDIVIDTGNDQILTFKRTKKTRFLKGASEIKPDDFPDAAQVTIEANRAMNGDLDAITVFLGEPPAKEKQAPPPS